MTGGTSDDPPPSAAPSGRQPGGLLGYFVNRKKTSEHSPPRPASAVEDAAKRRGYQRDWSARRYREMVNAGNPFGSMGAPIVDDGDSDDDNNGPRGGRKPAGPGGEAGAGAASSSSWLASFQRSGRGSLPSGEGTPEPPSSWMRQAWRSVDSAREWVLATSSSSGGGDVQPSSDHPGQESSSSYWAMPPSWSTAVSSALSSVSSVNPFSDTDASSSDGTSPKDAAAALPPASAFLPKFASRFEWATRRRNPYQAVIGRGDADYYLLSPRTSGVWNWLSWTSWLPWTTSGRGCNKLSIENGKGGDGNEGVGEGRPRTKRQPSEASVQAVKNLLSLGRYATINHPCPAGKIKFNERILTGLHGALHR